MKAKKIYAYALILSLVLSGSIIGINKIILSVKYSHKNEPSENTTEISEVINTSDEINITAENSTDIQNDTSEENTTTAADNENSTDESQNTSAEDPGNTSEQTDEPGEPEKSVAPVFVHVEKDYFDDALFVGDSRTVGIMEYGGLKNANYFADTGMSVFNVHKKELTVNRFGETTFDELISDHQFGKIYVMLGINELGNSIEKITEKYDELIAEIKEKQPDSLIYVCANMGVTKEKSDKDKVFTTPRIKSLNTALFKIAVKYGCLYIDVNPVFSDKDGNLSTDYARDFAHLYGKFYYMWVDFLRDNAVMPESNVAENMIN